MTTGMKRKGGRVRENELLGLSALEMSQEEEEEGKEE